MKYVKPVIYMVDRWVAEGETWVEIHDGKEGLNRSIIVANAKTATAARRRAKRILLGLVKKLEEYGDC